MPRQQAQGLHRQRRHRTTISCIETTEPQPPTYRVFELDSAGLMSQAAAHLIAFNRVMCRCRQSNWPSTFVRCNSTTLPQERNFPRTAARLHDSDPRVAYFSTARRCRVARLTPSIETITSRRLQPHHKPTSTWRGWRLGGASISESHTVATEEQTKKRRQQRVCVFTMYAMRTAHLSYHP